MQLWCYLCLLYYILWFLHFLCLFLIWRLRIFFFVHNFYVLNFIQFKLFLYSFLIFRRIFLFFNSFDFLNLIQFRHRSLKNYLNFFFALWSNFICFSKLLSLWRLPIFIFFLFWRQLRDINQLHRTLLRIKKGTIFFFLLPLFFTLLFSI